MSDKITARRFGKRFDLVRWLRRTDLASQRDTESFLKRLDRFEAMSRKSKFRAKGLASLLLCVFALSATTLLAGEEITKTNLPVIITSQIVTNVVEGNNQRGCSTCNMLSEASKSGAMPAIYHPPHFAEAWHAADEKWTITNTVKRVTMILEWRGQTLTHTDETVLNSTTNRFKLRAEWQKD